MDREQELEHVRGFLARWDHGHRWDVVSESESVESPDALLRRNDGSAVVGLEVTTPTVQRLAHSRSVEDRLVEGLRPLLGDITPPVQVLLSFEDSRALLVQKQAELDAGLAKLARVVRATAPKTGDSLIIEREQLDAEDIHFVRVVHLWPGNAMTTVGRSGYSGRGPRIGVVQDAIDAKVDKLSAYRTNTATRRDALASTAAVEGVWLLVVAFVGPGASTSILTTGAERLARRGFDRAFVLDYWDERVREIGTA